MDTKGLTTAYKPQFDAAAYFLGAKGRMPNDGVELCDWLREFAAFESHRADLVFKTYEDHMMLCTNTSYTRKP